MSDEKKIAEHLYALMEGESPRRSDEDFAILLADKLHEHRSPCHDLTDDDIQSIREVLKTAKRLDRGLFWLFVTLGGLIINTAYNYITEHMRWGQ